MSASPSPRATEGAIQQNLVEPGYTGRFRVRATVLESPDHGPQLCHVVLASMPPQCGGPDIVGWDWSTVASESLGGTTWGSYVVTGTWDRAGFTLTEPPRAGGDGGEPAPGTDVFFPSPCPTPPGGWRPVDPARATDDALQAANSLAQAEPDFAGLWLDQSYLQGLPSTEREAAANDPTRYVLNIMFTGDLPRHEAQIRAVWGGALCLSQAARSQAALDRIKAEVRASLKDQFLAMSSNVHENNLQAKALIAWVDDQRRFDAMYGAGTVVLLGWFEPID